MFLGQTPRRWLRERGIAYLRFYFFTKEVTSYEGDDVTLDTILFTMKSNNPGVYYILTGSSPADNHSVVCLEDRIVHDPAGRESGDQITGPDDQGIYTIDIFGAGVTLA